jgi:predicted CXXCH cytochrome family protein
MATDTSGRAPRIVAFFGLLSLFLAGCTDEKIVFREPFNPPPDASSGLVGYFTSSDKQTTCGNCHVGHQTDWVTTAHADAYATLTANAGAQDFCFTCHTVSQNGNSLTEAAGWNVVQDTAYHDVQCESCHGPGEAHVEIPDGGNEPLASIAASVGATNGCADCHTGTHHPFVEEWSQSLHATPQAVVLGRSEEEAADCTPCHTAQGVLRAWGVNSEYAERDAPLTEQLGITCAVCHDPHGSAGNEGQLRFPIDVPSEDQNLCVKCHHKRAEPEIESATTRGPHSPEGPLLLGQGAGWFPPGFEPEIAEILGTHGTTANPRLCATCHVVSYTVTDQETGDFQLQVHGHTFEAIQCVDANGAPLPVGSECTLAERDFASGCTTSGCHGTAEAARSAYTTATARIADLIAEVEGLLAQVPAGELANNDGRFTVADGAKFNVELAALPGSPIHNPFQIEQLLLASSAALQATYGLPAAVRRDLDRVQTYRKLRVDGIGR